MRRGSATIPVFLLLAACASPPPGSTAAVNAAQPWQLLYHPAAAAAWEVVPFGAALGPEFTLEGVILPMGSPLNGVRLRAAPEFTPEYEIEVVAARLLGGDFFCALTLPVAGAHGSVVLGGWGGVLCGFSTLDGEDASSNPSRCAYDFVQGVDYRVRVRVLAQRVTVWIEDQPLFDLELEGGTVGLRPEVEACVPLGIASYQTRARIREVRWRSL